MESKPVYHSSTKKTELKNPVLDKRRVFYSRLKRKVLRHRWLVRGLLLIFLGVFIYLILSLLSFGIRRTRINHYASLAFDFILTPESKIKSIDGRTNILILGKGGQGHEAPELTDAIIFVSVFHPTLLNSSTASTQVEGSRGENGKASITMISLPRDIWISQLRTKLNSIYYWGNQKQEGGGLVLAKSSVEEIVGKPVQYGVVLDFSGFVKIVDILSGVEIDVTSAFVDEKYPIAGREDDDCGDDPEYKCRYETVRFEKGKQLMDGETALKFVRSRNAEGDEGTDFARQIRQQKVLDAVKSRVLSRQVLLSPKKLKKLKDALVESTETDISPQAVAILARRALQAKDGIKSFVLPESLLENPPISSRYDNLYVFIPKIDGWEDVRTWVECILEKGDCK